MGAVAVAFTAALGKRANYGAAAFPNCYNAAPVVGLHARLPLKDAFVSIVISKTIVDRVSSSDRVSNSGRT